MFGTEGRFPGFGVEKRMESGLRGVIQAGAKPSLIPPSLGLSMGSRAE